MDSASRRAFALDSRTVWVEQQLVHGTLFARDNLPLGPGEYTPSISSQSRHISTPVIGKPRDQADFFSSFTSPIARRERATSPANKKQLSPLNLNASHEQGILQRLQSPTQAQRRHLEENSVSIDERSEFKTIFHEREKRDPYDSNRRYCVTPGPYLAHDSVLQTIKNDGKYVVRGSVPFGADNVPFGERVETKRALPTYDVNYDSKYIRPMPKLGSFPKNKRSQENAAELINNSVTTGNSSPTTNRRANSSSPTQFSNSESRNSISLAEFRCSLVKLPKVKRRNFTKIEFDDRSYHKDKKVLNMTPSLMRSEVKDRVFEKLMAIPRPHKAPGVQMSIVNSADDEDY